VCHTGDVLRLSTTSDALTSGSTFAGAVRRMVDNCEQHGQMIPVCPDDRRRRLENGAATSVEVELVESLLIFDGLLGSPHSASYVVLLALKRTSSSDLQSRLQSHGRL
jgi:hypothetical protein